MREIVNSMVNALAGIASAAIAGALWLNLKWLFNSKRSMEKILEEVMGMQSNLTIIFRMQGPLLMSLKASLEAQRDGQCDGNVDEAIKMISEEKKKFDEHLVSAAIAGNESGEKKK